MDLMSFREFMWNKRRNEYLRLKYTERYQQDPEPWETIYKDVSDTAVSGLTERVTRFFNKRMCITIAVASWILAERDQSHHSPLCQRPLRFRFCTSY